MEKLKVGFDFIFSSYKRAAAVLFVAAIILSIPITVSLLGQQQDIRQRAQEFDDSPTTQGGTISEETLRTFCNRCLSDNEKFACGRIRDGRLRVECRDEMSSSFGLCISCKNLPTPTNPPCPAPPICLPGQTLIHGDPPVGDGACSIYQCTGTTTCGDGICQNIACLSLTCPVSENLDNCPQDCGLVDDHCLVPPGTPLPLDCPQPSQTPTPTAPTPSVFYEECMRKGRGDANCDGSINTDDFNIWRDEFLDPNFRHLAQADFNNDNRINTDDFNIWRDGFIGILPPISPAPTCTPCQGSIIPGSPRTCEVLSGGEVPPAVLPEPPGGFCSIPISPTSACQWKGTCNSNADCPQGTSCLDVRPVVGTNDDAQNYCVPEGCPLPICLSENIKIQTPDGEKNVQDLQFGNKIYSQDENGRKIVARVLEVAKTYVGQSHKILNIKLADGRSLDVSPGHPTADGRDVATLKTGDVLDGSKIKDITTSNYNYEYTYDLLPDSTTGTYHANGILMGSTLKRSN